MTVVAVIIAATGCGASGGSDASGPTTTPSRATSTTTAAGSAIENTWVGPPVDLTRLPIGTDHVSTSEYAVGNLYVCAAGNPNGGGAFRAGPWINEAAGTWDATAKIAVQGRVSWSMARDDEHVDDSSRSISSNGLPVGNVTGTFPVASTDPAYAYDRNPNSIAENDVSMTLPLSPSVAATPTCLPKGSVGVLKNGVALFAPVDDLNRDAVAYETQDECNGHPQQAGVYHYHDVPACVLDASTGPSAVVGFARDGFPIVVERDGTGQLPTNADLDECHGRVSPIELDGEVVTTYHYSATYEFPYFIGCYRAAPV